MFCKRVLHFTSPYMCTLCPMFSLDLSAVGFASSDTRACWSKDRITRSCAAQWLILPVSHDRPSWKIFPVFHHMIVLMLLQPSDATMSRAGLVPRLIAQAALIEWFHSTSALYLLTRPFVPPKKLSTSTPAHDAVATALSHKYRFPVIIHVDAGPILLIFGSPMKLDADATYENSIFAHFLAGIFSPHDLLILRSCNQFMNFVLLQLCWPFRLQRCQQPVRNLHINVDLNQRCLSRSSQFNV